MFFYNAILCVLEAAFVVITLKAATLPQLPTSATLIMMLLAYLTASSSSPGVSISTTKAKSERSLCTSAEPCLPSRKLAGSRV